ncbi:probable E3 ubiquitin-protein ligase ATL44 [Setaria italica]|uniref:probable E3 ubiquitin-protein ligase ATL44 n=1 Tax=Setaria italica TaxID=4555 RepID=UPI0007199FF2|nr:probable E3 ubiquitin-protein ligase ATL44 [Setaria italica]
MSMSLDAATAAEVAAVVALAVLIVAIAAASAGACAGRAAAAVHDIERALGADTLVRYDQAKAAFRSRRASAPSTEGKENVEEEEAPSCAFCLSEYSRADELVRVVPACRHFFHAECGVDAWLRKRGTCPLCRGRVTPLPRLPRPECPPLPARARGDAWVSR